MRLLKFSDIRDELFFGSFFKIEYILIYKVNFN